MYTLYSMQRSGNCYKVRLALAQLRTPYRLVEVDILKGDTRTPRLAKWRHRAVTINDLPASLEQPIIMMGRTIRDLLRGYYGSPELL